MITGVHAKRCKHFSRRRATQIIIDLWTDNDKCNYNRRGDIKAQLRHYTILELMQKQDAFAPVREQARMAAKLGMLKPIFPLKPSQNAVYEEKRVCYPFDEVVIVLMINIRQCDVIMNRRHYQHVFNLLKMYVTTLIHHACCMR
jgi:hypothetical protein